MTPDHCKACARRRLDVITKQLCAGDVGPSTSCSTAPFTRQPTAAAAAAGVQGPRGRDHPSPGSQQPRQQQPLFKGRVVVITGAGKGIGEAAALSFAAQGARLVLADLDAAAAEDVAGRARAAGAEAVSVGGDVTDPAVPGRIVQAAMDHFGALHVLVNNAGYTFDGVIHKMTDRQWQAMLDVHCTAPFRLVQAAAPAMRDAAKAEQASSQGRASHRTIINISSVSGTHGSAGQANYATAKAGVTGLTKTIAKEWGPLNITCNAIAFGFIDTRLTRSKGNESILVDGKPVALGVPDSSGMMQMAEAMLPLRRIGTVDDAAGAILLLASPWASYITGQVLEVSGGQNM